MISENAFDTLRTTTLFAGFTDDQLQVVPKVALPHEFAAGDSIVSEGETPSRSLFLILEGEAEVVIGGEPHRDNEGSGEPSPVPRAGYGHARLRHDRGIPLHDPP